MRYPLEAQGFDLLCALKCKFTFKQWFLFFFSHSPHPPPHHDHFSGFFHFTTAQKSLRLKLTLTSKHAPYYKMVENLETLFVFKIIGPQASFQGKTSF